jgi:hypothetical protein
MDLAGNVDEWCDYDPRWPGPEAERPLRGGAYTGSFAYHRLASRDLRGSEVAYGLNGFRYAIAAP